MERLVADATKPMVTLEPNVANKAAANNDGSRIMDNETWTPARVRPSPVDEPQARQGPIQWSR